MSLVNLRARQDSGYFFLFETLEAYVYAADHGIDIVNMSFFADPWWANCRDRPETRWTEQSNSRPSRRPFEQRAELRVRQGVLIAEGRRAHRFR